MLRRCSAGRGPVAPAIGIVLAAAAAAIWIRSVALHAPLRRHLVGSSVEGRSAYKRKPRWLVRRFFQSAAGVAPQLPGRSLGGGWRAVYSDEHEREYFWHEVSGTTSWEKPVIEVPEKSTPALVDDPPKTMEAISAADAEPQRSGDGAIDASELPDGWHAIYSDEHGREFFWHEVSGTTTRKRPEFDVPKESTPALADDPPKTLEAISAADASAAGLEASALASELAQMDWNLIRRRSSYILSHNPAGHELQAGDFEFVRGLLAYHPNAAGKIGAGVRGIKIDPSPHESLSNCFWVLRTDGSVEDFSARKCLEALDRLRNSR